MADLCSCFVRRHLAREAEPRNFYQTFSEQVTCAKPEPEWKLYGSLFREYAVDTENDANAKGQNTK